MKFLRRLAAAALLALLWASPAAALIGTPVQLGTASGTTTAVITTGATAAPGSLIVVVVATATSNVTVTSVVDSQGNCSGYTALDNAPTASRPTNAIFYCANTGNNLASGQTITVTVPSTNLVSATAFYVSGMSSTPADKNGNQVNGTTNTAATSTATGTLSQSYELVVGTLALDGTSSAFTPHGNFTSIGGVSNADGSAYAAYQVLCGTATQAFAPTWTTSRVYMSNVVSFKASSANQMCVSKLNAYDVLQYGIANNITVSKANAYIVLSYATSVSKLNAYIVLSSTGITPKPFFHSFPP
jgi:hypothetical protein